MSTDPAWARLGGGLYMSWPLGYFGQLASGLAEPGTSSHFVPILRPGENRTLLVPGGLAHRSASTCAGREPAAAGARHLGAALPERERSQGHSL